MDFKSYLKDASFKLDAEINRILEDFKKEVGEIDPKLIPLIEEFIKCCQGGKRIRGTLVKLGYEIASSQAPRNDNGEIIKIGAAYEIFHSSILAHDDIIDQSPIRRNQPSLYKALGGNHYGLSQAICLGDIGFFLASKVIGQTNFSDKLKVPALNLFSNMVITTGLGEMLDVLPGDVMTIMKLKTAKYTISSPLQLGASLAGAKLDQLDKLDKFGENLGIAFQIQDDILGVFGTEQEIGKSVSSDIEEGKNTLLYIQALKKASSAQKQILDKYYGQGNLDTSGLEKIRKVFKDTDSLDYSRQFGVKYVDQSKKVIPQITKEKALVKILSGMADFLVERNS